jgi:hypothetical protein
MSSAKKYKSNHPKQAASTPVHREAHAVKRSSVFAHQVRMACGVVLTGLFMLVMYSQMLGGFDINVLDRMPKF